MLEAFVVGARVALTVVFAVASGAKLVDRVGTRQMLREFGVPALLARPLVLALPLAELAVAAALLPGATAWWAGLAALGLLLVFTTAIWVNLARGRRLQCQCFGQIAPGPVGWSTVVRNVILGAAASVVIWASPSSNKPDALSVLRGSVPIEAGPLWLLGTVVIGLIGAEAWLLLHLLAQNGRLLLRLDRLDERLSQVDTPGQVPSAPASSRGLQIGTRAPGFSLPTADGEILTLDSLRAAGKPVLLTFVDPDCGPCSALLPQIGRWQRDLPDRVTLAVVSRGTPQANRAKSAQRDVGRVLLQRDREIAEIYHAYGTPTAVLVRGDGTIGSPPLAGVEAIRTQVEGLRLDSLTRLPVVVLNAYTQKPASRPDRYEDHSSGTIPSKVGSPAPTLALPTLDGVVVSLDDFRGDMTLVLFWNPACGYCQYMLADLKAWEAQPPKGAPRLLIVATGTATDNAALGLRSTLVLDHGLGTGRLSAPMALRWQCWSTRMASSRHRRSRGPGPCWH